MRDNTACDTSQQGRGQALLDVLPAANHVCRDMLLSARRAASVAITPRKGLTAPFKFDFINNCHNFPWHMHMSSRLLAAIISVSVFCAHAATIDDAKMLLRQGQPSKARDLLEANLIPSAGDVEYNYILGIASLDSGDPGNAVFAFERALAINPAHTLARAELGKALIALTEFGAAYRELQQVKASKPPPDVAKRIDQLLVQLDKILTNRYSKSRPFWSAYVGADLGYDTNINTGPNATTIFIPALGLPGTLSGFATRQKSSVAGFNAGIAGQTPIGQDISLYASADATLRGHPAQKDFAIGSITTGLGIQVDKGENQYNFGITQFTQYISKYHNDDQLGIYATWQHKLTKQDIVGLFAQYIDVRHPIVPLINTDLYLIGATWTHAFTQAGAPRISLATYYGEDREKNNDPTIGRTLFGARANGEYVIHENLKLFGGISYQYSRYGGTSIFFNEKRKDNRYDANIGFSYKLDRAWTVTPQLLYAFNNSNIKFHCCPVINRINSIG